MSRLTITAWPPTARSVSMPGATCWAFLPAADTTFDFNIPYSDVGITNNFTFQDTGASPFSARRRSVQCRRYHGGPGAGAGMHRALRCGSLDAARAGERVNMFKPLGPEPRRIR